VDLKMGWGVDEKCLLEVGERDDSFDGFMRGKGGVSMRSFLCCFEGKQTLTGAVFCQKLFTIFNRTPRNHLFSPESRHLSSKPSSLQKAIIPPTNPHFLPQLTELFSLFASYAGGGMFATGRAAPGFSTEIRLFCSLL
jgi:hypothetical protein